MKLLRFPFLPLELILQQLLPIDLISLSCCSKKVRKTIKLARFSTEHRAFATEFEQCPKALSLHIQFPTVRQSLCILFQDTPRDSRRAAKIFYEKINEIQYPFRFVETDEMCILYTGERNGFRIAEYVMDLIRMTDVQKLIVDISRISNIPNFFSLKYIENASYIDILGESISSKCVSTLFNNLKGPLEYISIRPKIEGILKVDLNMLQTQALAFDKADWMTREQLLSMKGEYLCASGTMFNEDDVIALIKQWRDGSDTTLKNFMIYSLKRFNFDRITTEFNATPWDDERRAREFVSKGITVYNTKDYPIDCGNGFDFERPDGLLATIQLRGVDTRIGFYVWHNRFPVRDI